MANNTSQATVLTPTALVSGMSQSALGDEWWKTIHSIPVDKNFGFFNDVVDPRGRRGSVEKALEAQFSDSVLFLGGAYGDAFTGVGADETIQRTIVLPSQGNATVFFPLLNGTFENVINTLAEADSSENPGNKTPEQLRSLLGGWLNPMTEGKGVSTLFASVDGHAVRNPFSYRQVSESPFSYTAPYPIENSLLSSIGYTNDSWLYNVGENPIQLRDLAEGNQVSVDPVIADGYWLAVNITGGSHTLNFGGTLSADGEPFFALDITYNILNPIYGTNRKDNLNGTKGNDYLDGGDGADILMGYKGDDLIIGGNGADVLDGGKGVDELWGDAGSDTFIFQRGYGRDTIYDFERGDRIYLERLSVCRSNISEVELASGLSATQIDFGRGDQLTLVGVQQDSLHICNGVITL